jgi:hypothetical protein
VQRPVKGRLVVHRDREMPLPDRPAQCTQPAIMADQGRQGGIGALDEPDPAQVTQPPGPIADILEQSQQHRWQLRLRRALEQEFAKMVGGTAGSDSSEHRLRAECPDPVGGALGVALQDQTVGRADLAGRDHVEVGQDLERTSRGGVSYVSVSPRAYAPRPFSRTARSPS